MFTSKKGFEQWWLIMMIFSFFTLFLLFSFFANLTGTSNSSDNQACSLLFSTGLSSNAFYLDNLTNFNERFFDFTEEKCQYFSLEDVGDREVEIVTDRINKCWELTNSGDTILPSGMFGEGVCFYCGELLLEENFNFNSLQTKINEDYGQIENNFQKIEITSRELGVFYYQYREELGTIDSIGSYIDSEISDMGGFFKGTVDLFQPEIDIYTGITFAEIRESGGESEFYLDGIPLNERLNCKTIIPSRD